MLVQRHKRISPIWEFVVRYLFWVSCLYLLIYFEGFSPFVWIHHLHTDLSIYLTSLWIEHFDIPIVMSQSTLYYTHGLQLKILDECNGLAAILFFLAAILAYPAAKNDKITWILLSYIILILFNAIRIDLILYHVISYPEDFIFVHEIIGRYSMAFIPLILFYLYTDKHTQVTPTSPLLQL